MKNSLLISILVLLLSSCNRFICESRPGEVNDKTQSDLSLFASSDVKKFQTYMKFRKAEMTGILIIKKMNDSVVAGSFINEFGIKGFDFNLYPSKVKFSYMFRKLDKWYIRKSLGQDLHFLLIRPELKTSCFSGTNRIFVDKVNKTLSYVYFDMNSSNADSAVMYRKNNRFAGMRQSKDPDGLITIRMDHLRGLRTYELKEIRN